MDRETGSDKVGQRISTLWKQEERGGNCGWSTTSLIFQVFTPLLTPDFYQLRLIRFVLCLLMMICLIFYLIMFLFNALFSILLLDITEKNLFDCLCYSWLEALPSSLCRRPSQFYTSIVKCTNSHYTDNLSFQISQLTHT